MRNNLTREICKVCKVKAAGSVVLHSAHNCPAKREYDNNTMMIILLCNNNNRYNKVIQE